MIRLLQQDTDAGTLEVYDNGLRPLSPEEMESVHEALSRPLPWWIEWGTVVAVVGAILWLGHGVWR